MAGADKANNIHANNLRNVASSNFAQHLDMGGALSQCLYDTGYLKAILPDYEIADKAANPEKTNKNRAAWDGGRCHNPHVPIRKDTGVMTGI
jgi:hypothetical protein